MASRFDTLRLRLLLRLLRMGVSTSTNTDSMLALNLYVDAALMHRTPSANANASSLQISSAFLSFKDASRYKNGSAGLLDPLCR